MFKVGDAGVPGLMPFPEEMKRGHPVWNGYIAVDDVDAMAGRIKEAGGTIYRGPMEVPGVIRLAVVADPQGAVFLIAKGLQSSAMPDLPAGTPGTIGWRERFSPDREKDLPFIEKLFG